jgi:hypothetical protein
MLPTRLVKDGCAFGFRRDDGLIEARSYHLLDGTTDPFYELVKKGTLQTQELTEVIELDSLFYYSASQFEIDRGEFHNRKIAVEQGVGYLSKVDDAFIFTRTMIHAVYELKETGQMAKTRELGCTPYDFQNKDFFTIYAHRPDNYLEALMVDHSVLCSIDPYEPNPVHLPPNSILGRVGEGRIRAITFDELRTLLADTGG